MNFYENVSRAEFEKRKDFVEQIMRGFGCTPVETTLPYVQITTSIGENYTKTCISERPIYKFRDGFYRVGEVLFYEKPFIVLEYAETEYEVKNDIMEDCDPFPYDLSEEDTVNEVRYSLGIEPYPQS